MQAPSYASHWDLNGDGDNLQPPTNPNTETSEILKNQAEAVGAPLQSGQTAYSDFDGTWDGVTAGQTGISEKAYDFDGSDDVSIPSTLLEDDWTFSGWIKPDATGNLSLIHI